MWEVLFNHPEMAFETGRLVFGNVADPLWWWAAGAAAVLAIAISVVTGRRTRDWRWWQQGAVGVLQSAVVVGALLLLAGPGLQTTTLQPGANHVAVLLDVSGSMGFPDETGSPGSRLEAARALAAGPLTDVLSPLAEVSLFHFDTAATRTDDVEHLVAGGTETRLLRATDMVLSSFNGMPLAGVVVLSDGADNDDTGALDAATLARHGVPVYTIGFGPTALPGETELSDVQLTADAPPDSRVTARAVIAHSSSGEAVLKVRDAGDLIAARKVTLPPDSPTVRTEISFNAGRTGIRELTFELESPSGDQLAENNSLERLLTVSERRRRILYLEGEPRWEYKFLRRALAGDDVLEVVSWLRTTDRKTYRQGVGSESELAAGFPQDRATLYGFDVIVLGSLAASALDETQHEWLERFVSERGGSLLALAGREALDDGRWDVQPVAAALPVVLSRGTVPNYVSLQGRARPTTIGARSPLTRLVDAEGGDGWQSLPPLGDLQRLGALKPAATTLLELVVGEDVHPLLVTQPYGLGTTAVLATASTWRWQMRTPPDDPRHSRFWRQLLRQLAESAQRQRSVHLEADGDGIAIRAWLRDADFEPLADPGARATVTHADRSIATLPLAPGALPGLLTARYVPGAPGVYRVDVTLDGGAAATDEGSTAAGSETVTRFVRLGAGQKEYFQPVRNAALLGRVAELTGGRHLAPGEIGELAALLNFGGTGIRTVEVLPLWNLPIFFALLMALKLGEWWLRRVWGRI